jgi:hypothetical protein
MRLKSRAIAAVIASALAAGSIGVGNAAAVDQTAPGDWEGAVQIDPEVENLLVGRWAMIFPRARNVAALMPAALVALQACPEASRVIFTRDSRGIVRIGGDLRSTPTIYRKAQVVATTDGSVQIALSYSDFDRLTVYRVNAARNVLTHVTGLFGAEEHVKCSGP